MMDLELQSTDRRGRRRKFNVSGKEGRKKSKYEENNEKGSHVMRAIVFASHFFIIAIEMKLRNIGLLFSRKGLIVFSVSLLFFAVCWLGFLREVDYERPPDLYKSTNTQSRRNFDEASNIFPALDSWKIQIDVRSKTGGSVLSSGCLDDAGQVHNLFSNNAYYKRYCVEIRNGQCTTKSPINLQGFAKRDFEILTGLNLSRAQDVYKIFPLHESLTFYNISYNHDISIGGFVLTYFLKKPKSDQARLDLNQWIQKLSSRVQKMSQSLKFADVRVVDANFKEDKIWTILLLKHLPPFLYSIPIFLAVGIAFTALQCKCWLSIIAFPLLVTCISIGFISAFAISNILNIAFQQLYVVVPLVLFPKVFIDSLLLLKALDNVSHLPSSGRRASSSLVNGGFMVTVTTLMSMVLVGIPIWSSFKGISHLFVLTLLSFLFSYLTTLTLYFNIVLWITRKTPTTFLNRCTSGQDNEKCLRRKRFTNYWVQFLSTIPAKIVLIFVILGMISSSIYVVVTYSPRFKTIESFNKETDLKENNIKSFQEVTVIFKGLNYSSKSTRLKLIQFTRQVKSISVDSNGMEANWVRSFEKWRQETGTSCNFYRCLVNFFNSSIRGLYSDDLNFQKELHDSYIKASRFRIPVAFQRDIFDSNSIFQSFQIQSNSIFGENATATSESVLAIEDFMTFVFETKYVFILLAVTLLIFAFPLTTSFKTPFLLLLNFLMLSLEVLAVMFLLDIAFNQVSFSCIFLSFVISYDFSLYIAAAFTTSQNDKAKDRVVDAIHLTAIPIALGCLLLVLVSICLGYGFSHLSPIFMHVIPVTLCLGVFHATVFLPYMLMLFGDKFAKRQSRLPMNSLIIQGYTKRGWKYKVIGNVASTNSPILPGVAIIGMGCRFPQVSNLDEFWDMLTEGRCTVTSFPENRPEEYKLFKDRYHPKRFVSGRMCTLGGSYMEDIKGFDAAFFNISSQEANAMDPQQRILLQVAYEAIEDSGMKLEDLQACKTGVFVGLMNTDFNSLLTDDDNLSNIDQFASTGTTSSIMSNRLSFCFDFKGPSLTVDTACSSSLIALNIAIGSLRNGDCDIALVCGSNLLLCHRNHMVTSIAGLLAPDGRCKSFDSSGDGYGRGEGFAAVVLKLTQEATQDEDDIYCEIIACGMNNDGASATPMTAPSIRGQAEVSKVVLNKAGLQPHDIDYVEAHGTGTAIGDVVETSSIAEVYGVADRLLRIGSIKSNINHTESTAGLAGLMKLALMIKNGKYVPTINVHHLNPQLKLAEKGLVVQEKFEPWETSKGKPRIGAVNSFGYGGSNAHVILRDIDSSSVRGVNEVKQQSNYCDKMNVMTLSARSSDALKDSARFLVRWLLSEKSDSKTIRDICYSLNERRTVHPHRLAVAFTSLNEATESLKAFYDNQQGWEKSVSVGENKERGNKLLFMFGGQGAQWFGMGRELILKEAVVRDTISEIDKILRELGEIWNLKEELLASEEKSKVNEMVIGQVATFSVQFAIARLLISWGVHPSAVVGHSLGEYAASCIAGALSLKEALTLVLLRAKLQFQCPKNGAMAALGMSAENAQNLLKELKLEATVSIAAYNDANSVTLSGDKQSIDCFHNHLNENSIDVFWRILNTPRAFHSRHVVSIETSFVVSARKSKLKVKETSIPFYSTVEGTSVSGRKLDASYWWQNIRQPVKFHQAIKCAFDDGYRNIVEISVQPTLSHYVKQITSQEKLTGDNKPIVFSTLPRKTVKEQHKAFMQNTICSLHANGYSVQWHRVRGAAPCSFVRLPTYPWQEKDHWYRQFAPPKVILPLPSTEQGLIHPPHPFLGTVLTPQTFSGMSCWSIEIDLHKFPSLIDHALSHVGVVMPGSVYLEMALAMAKERFSVKAIQLLNVRLSNLLTLPESQVRTLRLRLTSNEFPFARFNISTIQDEKSELELSHGEILCEATYNSEQTAISVIEENCFEFGPKLRLLQERMKDFPIEEFHEVTKRYGFTYGPQFSVIKQAWIGKNEGLCLISIDKEKFQIEDINAELLKYVVHPSILDACLQTCFIPMSATSGEKTILPVGFDRIQLTSACLHANTICHAVQNSDISSFDITLMNLTGNIILKMKNFRVTEIDGGQPKASINENDIAYQITWKEAAFETVEEIQNNEMLAVILMDSSRNSTHFTEILKQRGVEVLQINLPETKDCGPEEEKEIARVIKNGEQRCMSSNKKLRIVSFWPIEADLVPEELDSIDRAQNMAFRSSLLIIKLVSELSLDASAIQITFVTQGICSVNEEAFSMKSNLPWSSTIYGLRRTAVAEYPNIVMRTVDLSPLTMDLEIEILADQLGLSHGEEELVIRKNLIFTSRVDYFDNAFTVEEPSSTKGSHTASGNLYFEQDPNSLEIFLREDTCSKLLEDEVVVELNHVFSHVERISVFANNRSPNYVGFSGRVLESKSSVFQAGEEVFGVTHTCRIGKRIKTKENHLIRKPQEMSLSQAAAIPSCFVMALEILRKSLPQQKSLQLLVHEGDASLGFAVTTVAIMHGYHVCCTVSKESKEIKKVMVQIGVETITDRSCLDLDDSYEDYFDAVVFVSSPRPGSIETSLRLLKPKGMLLVVSESVDGRFVLPSGKCIRYEGIQADDLIHNPASFSDLWKQHCDVVISNAMMDKINIAPHVTLNLSEEMKRWNVGGESLKKTPEVNIFKTYALDSIDHLKVLPTGIDHFGLKNNRTYIIVGGVRGFGFEVARWMCSNGAHTVVLLARSPPSKEKLKEVQDLQIDTGANVLIFQIDVSREDDLLLLEQQLQDLPSVAGIVHSAMVLRDNLIIDMDMESYKEVMAPKVKGGYLLHKLSLKMDLDFFVMFSSMASMVFNVSQASYSAANAFLDGLASYRRNVLGVPGLSINWGPIGGAGVLARKGNIAKMHAKSGLGLIPATEGPKYMSRFSCCKPNKSQIGLFIIDWSVFIGNSAPLFKMNRLHLLKKESEEKGSSVQSLASRILQETNSTKRSAMIKEFVVTMIAFWADMESTSEVDVNTSLYNYGIDSTAALSLKMTLESSLQISFEVFYFMQPETTPAKMTLDIVKWFAKRSGDKENKENSSQSIEEESEEKKGPSIESQQIENPSVQVFPLYDPANAEIKFFCIHPAYRFAMNLASIANGFQIQNIASFYAIGFKEPIYEKDDWGSVRELALQYVDLIRKEQKHGPYFLGGYSYGGIVAYEMACILEEHKEKVEFVCMIDTYPWSSMESHGGYHRLASWFRPDNSQWKNVEMLYENFIEKVAKNNLNMTGEEYEVLQSQRSTEEIVLFLKERSEAMNIPIYDLTASWEMRLHDSRIANHTHGTWEPPAIQYSGSVTYLACQDQRFSPKTPLMGNIEDCWRDVFRGPMDVLVCPGNHFSLSEMPFARITGGIVATAVGVKYRSLHPDLNHINTAYVQKKAVNRLKEGLQAILYPKKARKNSKIGHIYLNTETKTLIFCKGNHPIKTSKMTGKTIKLQDLHCIMPGRYVRKAIRVLSAKRKTNSTTKNEGGNLSNVVSLFGKHRIYNVEFLNFEDLKVFYLVVEGLLNVKMEFF